MTALSPLAPEGTDDIAQAALLEIEAPTNEGNVVTLRRAQGSPSPA
jgi:hypothetical protein